MNAEPRPVIILINPAARERVPMNGDALAVPIPFLTGAAVPVHNVLPAVTHLLITGVLITEHVMATAVRMEHGNLVTRAVVALAAVEAVAVAVAA